MRSTGGETFTGLQLRSMEKSLIKKAREDEGVAPPASPQPGSNKKKTMDLTERGRMNVTYTDGRKSPFDLERAEILDERSDSSKSVTRNIVSRDSESASPV